MEGKRKLGSTRRYLPILAGGSSGWWPVVTSSPHRITILWWGQRPVVCSWVVSCQLRVAAHFLGGSPAPACAAWAIWASWQHWAGFSPAWVINVLSRAKQWLAGLMVVFAARHMTGPTIPSAWFQLWGPEPWLFPSFLSSTCWRKMKCLKTLQLALLAPV